MLQRTLANLYIAIDAVTSNKVRSLLTALGIIFGVAAVIAMLAIGNGAQQEILDQIKLVGVNNIVVKPVIEQEEEKIEEGQNQNEKKEILSGPYRSRCEEYCSYDSLAYAHQPRNHS